MKTVNDFSQGKMDKEISGKTIPKGVYRDLLNGRVSSSDNSSTGVIENLKGTNKITIPALTPDHKIIGMTSFDEKLYYIATNNLGTTIGEYDLTNSTHRYIIKDSPSFDLNKDTPIAKIEVFEGMLIFCDYNHDVPYKINIERAVTGFYTSKKSVMLVKAPPIKPPFITTQDKDDNNPNTNFKENSFQFAYRFHYLDGEISAISQRSQVAFKSLYGQVAKDTVGVIDAIKTDYGFDLQLKVDAAAPATFKLYAKTSGAHGTYVDTVMFYFDYIKQGSSYKCVIFRHTADHKMEVLEFTLGQEISRRFTINVSGNNPHVVMCKQNPQSYFVSFEHPNHDIYVYDQSNTEVATINAHQYVYSSRPVALSANGKYVYVGYNDELAVSTKSGADNTYTHTLHVDENSTPGGKDIYSQGELLAVCCSESGRNVFAVVGPRKSRLALTIARSYDYGSTWETSANISIGAVHYEGAQIVTDLTGAKVTIGFVLPNKLVFKTSTDGGITFPITNEYVKATKVWVGSLFMNMSLDGNSLYIGYLSSGGLGHIEKSINDGSTFSNLLSTSSTAVEFLYAMKTDVLEEADYDNNFIQNDIACVNIDTTPAIITPDVKYLEVIAFDVNTGKAYSIVKDTPNKITTVEFCNDTTYKLIADKDINKLYDNVPHKARSLSITQNTLIFGGYTDGYTDSPIIDVRILDKYYPLAEATGHSLKHGVKQSYAIIYYDDFNRSSDAIPIGDVDIHPLRKDPTRLDAYVSLQISGLAPSWATSYAIAKKPALLDYEIINGFDSAHIYNNKLYLETTSYKDYDFQDGSKIELVLETGASSGYVIATAPLELKVTNVITINENIVAGDGSTVLLPNGHYVIASTTDLADYNKAKVIAKTSKYTSSIFYVHEPRSVVSDKVYFELPYRFNIVNGVHQGGSVADGSLRASSIILPPPLFPSNGAKIDLLNDYDVVLSKDFPAEIYRLSSSNIINNLGRPNLDSENFAQIDRYAGLCASEVYVQDTNFNGFSSFNLWLQNYKDLDRHDGEIKLIDSEDTNIEVYQEDRVSKVMYKKNILSMADGRKALSQTQDIWGEQQKYLSEYGLSHPSSFAKWGESKYYVDAKRGVVIRKQGITLSPISYAGMNDYLHDALLRNKDKSILGYFEPEFGTYHIITNENIAFSEKAKGWEYRSSLIPDFVYNDDSDVYSFKDLELYKHNVGNPNEFYDIKYKTRVITYINDKPIIVKIYNAIQINGTKPESIELSSGDDKANIIQSMFEEKEKCFFSYIPMNNFVLEQPTVVAGVCSQDVAASPIIPLDNIDKHIHVGDEIYIYSNVNHSYTQIGELKEINENSITLKNDTIATKGNIIIAKNPNDVNGNNLRSRFVKLVIEFPDTDPVSFESYLVDIDISKQ